MADTKTLALPDTQEIDKKALTVLETSKALSIQTDKNYVVTADFLKDLKTIQKEIDDTFDPAIRAAHDAHKAVLAAKAKHARPLEEAERVIKLKMIAYQDEREKKRREEEERLREAAKRQEEEDRNLRAEKLLEEGKPEEALALLGLPIEKPSIILPNIPEVKGIVTREHMKAEVYDLPALIKAVAEGKAPTTLLEPNMTAINGLIRAAGGEIKIPGVRVDTGKVLATTGG